VYLTQWKSEETCRFEVKLHVGGCPRAQLRGARQDPVQVLVHAVGYLVSRVVNTNAKRGLHFRKSSEKDMRFYAAADAINRLLFASRSGPEMS